MYKTSGLIQEYYLVLGKKIKLGTQTTVFVSTLCKTLLSLYRANKQAKYYLRAVKSQLTCLTQTKDQGRLRCVGVVVCSMRAHSSLRDS